MTKNLYPRGTFALFLMQLTSMVGFMFIFSTAILYATKVLGYTDKQAYTLFAAYGAIVYGLPLFGGFLGDRFLGHKSAVLISTIFCGVGLLLISVPNHFFFTFGLAFFSVATCVQVPNMYCLTGQLYDKYDERRHSGFTLSYVGMNVGAFVAAASSGYFYTRFGFTAAYIISAVVMFLTLIAYFNSRKYFHEGIRDEEDKASVLTASIPFSYNLSSRLKGILLFFLAIPICCIGFNYPAICNLAILVFGIAATTYLIYLSFQYQGLQRKKIWIFLVLTLVSIGWGVLYMIAPTVLTLFAERNIDRHLFGWLIPTSSIISLDSFFIITCGPLIGALWLWLSHKGKNPSGAFKLATGVILMGLGYVIFVPAIALSNSHGFTAFYWIVVSYFFQSMGELFVNPVGYALTGSLAPEGQEGFLMGFFQLGAGISSVLMGYAATEATTLQGVTDPLKTNAMYSHAFWQLGFYSLLLGAAAVLLCPYFAKIIRQQH